MDKKITPSLDNLELMYKNLTYFDQYGGSVLLFIIISIVIFLAVSYCFVMINSQPIIDDWPNQRCKPQVIPFAGLITHPEGVTASEYTSQNFTYCTQNILSSITGYAVEPLTFITNMLQSVVDSIKNAIVIDTRVVVRTDCGDWTCHMHPSGHKKVATKVIKSMKLKTY